MSLCVMSARSVRRLNREYGTEAINAAVHNYGAFCVGVGGSVFWIDRRTGRVDLVEPRSTFHAKAFGSYPVWWM